MATRRSLRSVILPATGAVGLLLASFPATAQVAPAPEGALEGVPADAAQAPTERNWKFLPRATLYESVTDNVRLTPSGREADLISTLSPGASLDGKTRRLEVRLDGEVGYNKYASASDLDGVIYNFAGNGHAELAEKLLFLDVRSAIDQQAISRTGIASPDQRTLPSNQAQVFNNSISPYLRHEFGTLGTGELRYRFSTINFSDANTGDATRSQAAQPTADSLSNSYTNEYSVKMASGQVLSQTKLTLDASNADSTMTGDREVTQRAITGSVQYSIIRELALIARGGFDSYKDSSTDTEQNNPSWRLGTLVTPGPRSSLMFEGGQRYGGPYFAGNFLYKLSETLKVTASHDESVTNQQAQANQNLNNLVRNSQGFLVDPQTGAIISPNSQPLPLINQSYVMKDSRIALSGERGPHSGIVELYYITRDIGTATTADSGTEQQSVLGVNTSLRRAINPISGIGVRFALSKMYDSNANGENTIGQVTLTYDYKLSDTLTSVVSLQHYALFNQVDTGYRENLVGLSLRKDF